MNSKKGKKILNHHLNFFAIEDGVNIDNWTFDDLAEAIREFRCIQAGEEYIPKPATNPLNKEGSATLEKKKEEKKE